MLDDGCKMLLQIIEMTAIVAITYGIGAIIVAVGVLHAITHKHIINVKETQ